MSRSRIDLDDAALTEVVRLSGAGSAEEAVNLALREYAARHRRLAALGRDACPEQRPAGGLTPRDSPG